MIAITAHFSTVLTLALLMQCARLDAGQKSRALAGTPTRATLVEFMGRKAVAARRSVARERWRKGVTSILKDLHVCELFVGAVQLQFEAMSWGIGVVTR